MVSGLTNDYGQPRVLPGALIIFDDLALPLERESAGMDNSNREFVRVKSWVQVDGFCG